MTMTTYLVALVDGGGTVPVELGVVRRLVERGHDVTVLAEDSMADDVRGHRCHVPPLGRGTQPARTAPPSTIRTGTGSARTRASCSPGCSRRSSSARCAATSPTSTRRSPTRRPDVVLCAQFAFGAMVAAEAAGIPFDVLMPNVYLLPSDGVTPFGLGLRPAHGRPRPAAGRRPARRDFNRMWDKGLRAAQRRAGRARPGGRSITSWTSRRAPGGVWVLTSEEFDFPGAAARPTSATSVRCSTTRTWAGASGPRRRATTPLVLVGLSSTFQDHVATLQRIVDALATLPVRAIVTTGPALDPATVTGAANVVVVASAPHGRVLEHAAVVVTHGGHGTVVKALAAGVPLVVLPHGRDQLDNAVRVTCRGAGVKLKRTATSAQIVAAVSDGPRRPGVPRGGDPPR